MWFLSSELNTVDKMFGIGNDLTNCKCLTALDFRSLRRDVWKGTFTTLPWNRGQHKLTLIPYSLATSNTLVYWPAAFDCHFMMASGIPKLNFIGFEVLEAKHISFRVNLLPLYVQFGLTY